MKPSALATAIALTLTAHAIQASDTEAAPAWYQNLEITGLIEVEASYIAPENDPSTSDLVLATAELGMRSKVHAWVEAGISFLYEQDVTDLEVDTAFVTLANATVSPLFLTAGQLYVPFGVYDSNLVSDPLTLELGETRETALQLGFEQRGFAGSVYVFNGDHNVDGRDRVASWGATLGFTHEQADRAWSASVGYLNDLGESDTLQETIAANRVSANAFDPTVSSDPSERTGGWTAQAGARFGGLTLIGEYLTAAEDFDSTSLAFGTQGARPAAWNLEAGYRFSLFGRESGIAVAYQGTREALALELPEERWALGWSIALFEGTALGLEWAHDRDYATRDGGSGQSTNIVTAQLAVEF